MTSDKVEKKAHDYLTGGRVKVRNLIGDFAEIEVSGSSAQPYRVHRVAGLWVCSCPATTPLCAHVVAAKLITIEQESGKATSLRAPSEYDDLFSIPSFREEQP